MTAQVNVTPMSERIHAMVNVDAIDVVSSRGRGQHQFKQNVQSIADNGLYKPVLLNAIDHERTGRYQLICGEGRLLAHIRLKLDRIKAEIVKVPVDKAHLMSLSENLTKCKPKPIEYAYALLDMHEKGASFADLERITGHPGHYVKSYVTLVKNGEERLIQGVERGLFPLQFAMRVAETPAGAMQHVMMDAFDKKLITAHHVDIVRNILIDRSRQGPSLKGGGQAQQKLREKYSTQDLMQDIARLTEEKEKFVSEADYQGTRLISMIDVLRRLESDVAFTTLLKRHGLTALPSLQGIYGV